MQAAVACIVFRSLCRADLHDVSGSLYTRARWDALEEYQFIPSTKFGGYTECFHLDYRKEVEAAFRAAKQKYEG